MAACREGGEALPRGRSASGPAGGARSARRVEALRAAGPPQQAPQAVQQNPKKRESEACQGPRREHRFQQHGFATRRECSRVLAAERHAAGRDSAGNRRVMCCSDVMGPTRSHHRFGSDAENKDSDCTAAQLGGHSVGVWLQDPRACGLTAQSTTAASATIISSRSQASHQESPAEAGQ